jgi:hypothetical protein
MKELQEFEGYLAHWARHWAMRTGWQGCVGIARA